MISENGINNNSLVCKLIYKNFSILFTGDIESIAEKSILQKYKIKTENSTKKRNNDYEKQNYLNTTILKVGHHGSKTSSTQEFVDAVKPKLALIGVGEKNKFGHPNDDVIERLKSMRNSDISYRPNGRNINNSK